MTLVRVIIVGWLVLACCLACDSGNTNTCISDQGGVTNCGAGSAVGGSQPSSLASTPAPSPISSQSSAPPSALPSAVSTTVPAGDTAPTSQYLSNLDSVANSGWLLTGAPEVNGRSYPNSVVQYLDPGPDSVSYNLGRQWRTLDMTLGLSDKSTENETAQFQLVADGRTIYTGSFTLGQSQHVRLNVSGVLRLDLTTTLASDYVGGVYADWGSAELLS
jgi:hypothetical protein